MSRRERRGTAAIAIAAIAIQMPPLHLLGENAGERLIQRHSHTHTLPSRSRVVRPRPGHRCGCPQRREHLSHPPASILPQLLLPLFPLLFLFYYYYLGFCCGPCSMIQDSQRGTARFYHHSQRISQGRRTAGCAVCRCRASAKGARISLGCAAGRI